MNLTQLEIARGEYIARRKATTEEDIKAAKGSVVKLTRIKKQREGLARTYEEDGARDTARIIRETDIQMLNQAINGL